MSLEEQLFNVFVAYCQFGGGHQVAEVPEMDSRTIQKLAKECRLLDRQCTKTDVDLIFTRVKGRTARKVTFEQFQQALAQIGDKKGVDFESVARAAIMQGGPGVNSVTRAESVRFHDDQSTYTGVYARGGPTCIDPTITLSDLADRTPSDVRGRKIDNGPPPQTAGAATVTRQMPRMDSSPQLGQAQALPPSPMQQQQQQPQQHAPVAHAQSMMEGMSLHQQGPDPELRQWLVEFFQTYNPAKIGNVDVLLQQYMGREEDLMNKLAQKYNVPGLGTNPLPAPPAPGVGAQPGQFSSPAGANTPPPAPPAAGGGSPYGGSQGGSPSQGRGRGRGASPGGGGSIFDRLTDSSQYTGAHKHRFDETGRGRGLAGRDPITKGSGSGGPVRNGRGEYTGSTNVGTDQVFHDSAQFLMRR